MSRLGLLNRYSTLNVGDASIYAAYESMAAASGVGVAAPIAAPVHPAPLADSGLRCDAYLAVGGDVWNNARPRLITRSFLANLARLYRSPPERTFVFGQSVPVSCRGFSFAMLCRALRRVSAVHVRDTESHARLTGAGVPARLGYDSAFGLSLPKQGIDAAHSAFQRMGADPGRVALLSGRCFNAMYPVDNRRAFDALAKLIVRLARRGHRPVFLVQAMVDAHDQDHALATRLQRVVPELEVLDAFGARDYGAQPWELACGAAALARIVIGVRFHTSVFRMLAGRSAFVAHYSGKGRDLVRRLGQPGCAIDALDADRHIGAIEATAETAFDIASVRQQVRADFRSALGSALAQPDGGATPTEAASANR